MQIRFILHNTTTYKMQSNASAAKTMYGMYLGSTEWNIIKLVTGF